MKLVLLYKHTREIGINIPDKGVSYPAQHMSDFASPISGRLAAGIVVDLDVIKHIDLLPEEPDPLPKALEKNADPEFIREYKLSQARTIAENIKQNEALVRALQSHEEAGNIKILGRAKMDAKGNLIKNAPEVFAPEPKVEPEVTPVKEETIAPPSGSRGRPKKVQPTQE